MPSHVTKNVLDDPKSSECFACNYIEFFGPNQKALSYKWLRYGYSYKFHVL